MAVKRGPRGGKTTRTEEMVRSTVWLRHEEKAELRKQAYLQERTESAILRQALRKELGLPAIQEPEEEV